MKKASLKSSCTYIHFYAFDKGMNPNISFYMDSFGIRIIHESWYAIKQRNQTKPNLFFHSFSFYYFSISFIISLFSNSFYPLNNDGIGIK